MNILTYEDLIKKDSDKNEKYERLQTTSYINKRENYDDSNKIINGLNEEILSLKRKMKFVFEKDKEIEKLKYKIIESEKKDKNIDNKYYNENIALKQLNESLKEKNIDYLNQIEDSLYTEHKENDKIKEYIKEIDNFKDIIANLIKENTILKRKINIMEKGLDTIDFDIEPKLTEAIVIDIEKFKKILHSKFKHKNYNQILIKYGIDDRKSINKNMMNDIIKEIMLN
jgi:hypothetical protein